MCLCDDGLVGEARSLLTSNAPGVDVTEAELHRVLPPSPQTINPFKRKGPAPTPLGHKRVESTVPKRARTKFGVPAADAQPAFASRPVEKVEAASKVIGDHTQTPLPASILNLLRSAGVKSREDVVRELSTLRKRLALPPKKRCSIKGF